MIRRALCILAGLLAAASPLAAADKAARAPSLLDAAVVNWLEGKNEWAFTQRMRAFDDDGKVREELLTRYDPSQPDNRRWQLLELNGRPPLPEKRASWEKSKNSRPRKHANKPLDEIFDLAKATQVKATERQTIYRVPVQSSAARLAQVEKLDVDVAVGRDTKAIERVTAGIREPMRVALGLATVTGLELDFRFDPEEVKNGANADVPDGTARASVSKFGDLIEYEWSDFKRVVAYVKK